MENTKHKISVFQIALILLGLAVFILFLPVLSFVFNIGSIVGMLFGIIIILVGVFFNKIKQSVKVNSKTKSGKIKVIVVSAILFAVALTIIILFSINTSLIVKSQKNEREIPRNTPAIVLGCAVNGEKPSLMLQKRLDAALNYLNENSEAVCILSGGKGDDENISEAQAMFNYLTQKGVDANRLLLEDKSTTTIENIANSKKILNENGFGNEVVIITTEFHQYRASEICKKQNLETFAYSSQSGTFSYPTFLVRENCILISELFTR